MSDPQTILPRKRGDTFSLRLQWKDANGDGIDLTPYTITSQIRKPSGAIVASLTGTADDQSITNQATTGRGWYTLETNDPDTSGWPLGTFQQDVQYVSTNQTVSSPTWLVPIIADITRAA